MSSTLKSAFAFISLFVFTLFVPVAFGAPETTETDVPGDWYLPQKASSIEGSVNCFDYYTFGSVQVDASPVMVSDIVPGKTITFKGKIKNANPYPIVDGQVHVKIFKREQTSESALMQNGYPIIDFFLAKDAVFLAAQADQDIMFDWSVPSTAEGEYQAAFYFTSAYRYNLLGLSFTDDITGNKSNFSVIDDQDSAGPVVFDKNSILLNEKEFHPTTFLPRFSRDEKITAYASIINPEAVEKTVQVTWVTSRWDGILASYEQKKETVSIQIKPGETRKFSYEVPKLETAVTFIQAIVQDGDAKSILHIRFLRDGYEEVRINFPSILKYPLVQGEENTIFSCVHSTSSPVVPGNTLTLTLKDEQGEVLHEYVYNGSVTGEMMGVKDSFLPNASLTNFSLTARLEQGATLLEEVTLQYDCNQIDPALCAKDETVGESASTSFSMTRFLAITVFTLAVVMAIIVLLVLKKNRMKNVPPRIPPALILMAMLIGSGLLSSQSAQAASVSWFSSGIPDIQGYIWGERCVNTPANLVRCNHSDPDVREQATREWVWIPAGAIFNPSVTVNYSASVKNDTTNITGDAVAVAVGDSITFSPTAKSGTDIAWNVTGYSNDTPYGNWSDSTSVVCNASTFTGSAQAGGGAATAYYSGYAAVNVSPNSPTITKSGTATLSCDASGFVCTVTGAGTINATITWPATPGYFNYAYSKSGYINPRSADYLPVGTCLSGGRMRSGGDPDSSPEYVLNVPAQSVNFNLTAVGTLTINVQFLQ